jgi:uncharacterized protein (TIGR02679 family)
VSPLAAWVRDAALKPVWAAARERLERNGIEPRGTLTVRGLDRAGRHAVSGLVGRPVLRETVRLELAVLDDAARERGGAAGLVALLEALGGPLRNRVAERSASAAAREAPHAAAREWLAANPAVSPPWVEEWLSAVRGSGLLSRLDDADLAGRRLVQALQVAHRLMTAGTPSARNVLAATVTGDAHALDDGTVLSQLVLRALALATGDPLPATTGERRALWERFGVSADTVSSTALVLGLRPVDESAAAARLRAAADAGDPVHVTGWDLARTAVTVSAGTWVLVCENPRVLEAVAQRCGGRVAVACTSGMPGVVAVELLRRLRAGGAELAYHGDFDWPGIAIANRLVAQLGCTPWRMSGSDYLTAVRPDGLPLQGQPVEPSWDAALGAAMREHGVAVHEEAVLDTMLAAL